MSLRARIVPKVCLVCGSPNIEEKEEDHWFCDDCGNTCGTNWDIEFVVSPKGRGENP